MRETKDKSKKFICVSLMIFIAVVSIFVGASKVPNTKMVQHSLDCVQDNQERVFAFTGATVATSLALSALPDDFASPLANTVASMNKYFVIILITLFIEKILLVEGIKYTFMLLIPAVCAIYGLGYLFGKIRAIVFAKKLAALALVIIFVVPTSTFLVDKIGTEYLAYVDETIQETEDGSDKINSVKTESNDNATFLDEVANVFDNAIQSMKDLIEYFKNIVKKCVNAIAIMIVTTFVVPFVTCMFFIWFLKEVFKINVSLPEIKIFTKGDIENVDADIVNIEEVD